MNRVRARIAQINGVGGSDFITEAFTKQHFIAVANILKEAGPSDYGVQKVAVGLVRLFKGDNPNFRSEQFLKAAGFDKAFIFDNKD